MSSSYPGMDDEQKELYQKNMKLKYHAFMLKTHPYFTHGF